MGEDSLYDEQVLLSLVAGGDKQAFHQLFNIYWDRVYVSCLHLTRSPEVSKDLAQDIFLKLWENRSGLISIHNFGGYLYTISKNLVHDYLRTKVFRESNREFLMLYFASDDNSLSHQMEQRELMGLLKTAVEKLPPQLKRVFMLHRFEGLSHEEIAQRLGISPVSSKTYMVRALLELREQLGKLF